MAGAKVRIAPPVVARHTASAALTSAMVRSIAVGAAHIHTSVGGNVLGSTPQEPRSRAKQSPRPFWRHLWQTYPCARPASYIRRFSQAIGFACNCRVLSAGLPPPWAAKSTLST